MYTYYIESIEETMLYAGCSFAAGRIEIARDILSAYKYKYNINNDNHEIIINDSNTNSSDVNNNHNNDTASKLLHAQVVILC